MNLKDAKRVADTDNEHAELLRKLVHDPRTSRAARKLLHEIDPKYFELEAEADKYRSELEERLSKDKEERDKEKIEAESAKVRERLEHERSQLVARYGEDEVKEMEELGEKHMLGSYEVMEKLHNAERMGSRPQREPTPRFGERWESAPVEWEEFRKDPKGAALKGMYAEVEKLVRDRERQRA